MQMHHLVPPQQQYQGFEPEDASLNNTNTSGMPIAYNGYNYGPAAGYYGDQFGNYGNAFNSTGFVNSAMGQQDTNMGLPPLANRQMGYDPTQSQNQQQNNGGYMSGSGEYWR
ncbi:NEGATIVE ELONGATION FACTOR A (NELF-A) [Plasmopara halstedii]|uniref:NEGATIVE ELONGATION FACTOR A (NELF-A) n=1 Tax=Plasmopara halstedii TaxID=4781 RepID=A0A0P1AQU1_PLAHL|nr:NEGATIVE ELONGATION FACTOR A (NELF-A) [Plasmopara halstedii]CEG43628.1 NEGATIVE ELONGATION FACTOR A (NELF-A) [Plasmopara halstedii]|eukprot:XP_024579997.1 NEGATIVE ELONGATION FACTOR A (NELF-A) [Plasmopara halstedii]